MSTARTRVGSAFMASRVRSAGYQTRAPGMLQVDGPVQQVREPARNVLFPNTCPREKRPRSSPGAQGTGELRPQVQRYLAV